MKLEKKVEITKEYIKGKSINGNNTKIIDDMIYQECCRCKEYKPLSYKFFNYRNCAALGFQAWCKSCKSHQNKRYRHFNSDGKLRCCGCKQYFSVESFNKSSTLKHREYRDNMCKLCDSERKFKIRKSKSGQEDLLKHLSHILTSAKGRANKIDGKGSAGGKGFNLSIEYLLKLWDNQSGKCAVSGLFMTNIIYNGKIDTNTSLDRINPKIGYLVGNIQLVCSQVNMMKGEMNLDRLIFFCENIISNNKNRNHAN